MTKILCRFANWDHHMVSESQLNFLEELVNFSDWRGYHWGSRWELILVPLMFRKGTGKQWPSFVWHPIPKSGQLWSGCWTLEGKVLCLKPPVIEVLSVWQQTLFDSFQIERDVWSSGCIFRASIYRYVYLFSTDNTAHGSQSWSRFASQASQVRMEPHSTSKSAHLEGGWCVVAQRAMRTQAVIPEQKGLRDWTAGREVWKGWARMRGHPHRVDAAGGQWRWDRTPEAYSASLPRRVNWFPSWMERVLGDLRVMKS